MGEASSGSWTSPWWQRAGASSASTGQDLVNKSESIVISHQALSSPRRPPSEHATREGGRKHEHQKSRTRSHTSSLVVGEPRRTRSAPTDIDGDHQRHHHHHHHHHHHRRRHHRSKTATSSEQRPALAIDMIGASATPAPGVHPLTASSLGPGRTSSPRAASLASTRSLISQARRLKVKAQEKSATKAREGRQGKGSRTGSSSSLAQPADALAAKAEQHRAWLGALREEAARRNQLSVHDVYLLQSRWVRDPNAFGRAGRPESSGSAAHFAMWSGA